MAEHKSILQSNVGWLETFKMGRKAPAVAYRIFKTLADAQEYADDPNDSATEGIRITVLSDPDPDNNGVYYVQQAGDGYSLPGILVKICRGNCAWFKGNQVDDNHLDTRVNRSQPGDAYMNTSTLDIYVLQDNNGSLLWVKVGNLVPERSDRNQCYYKIDTQCDNPPQFSVSEWNATIEGAKQDYENLHELNGQLYLWTRLFENDDDQGYNLHEKYTCALIYSSLDLGVFTINN